MDPYTEYLGTGTYVPAGLAQRELSYRYPQPRAARRPRTPRSNRWLRWRA